MTLDFAIVGAQKAGTTFLQRVLNQHPSVAMPRGETPYFEDPDHRARSRSEFEMEVAALRRRYSAAIVGIKRPSYFARDEVPGRLASFSENVRILLVLREPVSRALSAYYHYMREGFLPVVPAEQGFSRLLTREYQKDWPRSREILEFGKYGTSLVKYLGHFAPSQIHIDFYDRIKVRPQEFTDGVTSFLSLPRIEVPLSPSERPMAGKYNLTRLRLLQATKPLTTEYFHGGMRSRQKRPLLAGAIEWVDSRLLAPVWPSAPPVLSDAISTTLTQFYSDDIRLLRDMVNTRFPDAAMAAPPWLKE